MERLLEGVSTMCVVLIAAGTLARLCPQDKMVQFVQGLVVLSLLCAGVAALFSANWQLDLPEAQAQETQGQLEAFISSQYERATEEEAARSIKGLLGAAGLVPKKITVKIDSLEDPSIVLAKVSVSFAYPTDSERAWALLRNVLGDDVEIEVTADGS